MSSAVAVRRQDGKQDGVTMYFGGHTYADALCDLRLMLRSQKVDAFKAWRGIHATMRRGLAEILPKSRHILLLNILHRSGINPTTNKLRLVSRRGFLLLTLMLLLPSRRRARLTLDGAPTLQEQPASEEDDCDVEGTERPEDAVASPEILRNLSVDEFRISGLQAEELTL